MHYKKTAQSFLSSLILTSLFTGLLTGLLVPREALSSSPVLSNYIKSFYNKHSLFLDQTYHPLFKTWHFDTPYYSPKKRWQHSTTHPRWHMSEAAFYRYRLKEKNVRARVRDAVFASTLESNKALFDQSFETGIAQFLVIRLIKADPTLLNEHETRRVLNAIRATLGPGVRARDTQNRAALAAVYWYSVSDYLFSENYISKEYFDSLLIKLNEKIDRSVKDTVSPDDFHYREDGRFSLHYHIVEAYMLLMYGTLTEQSAYINLAEKMTTVLNSYARSDGFLNAHKGHRPNGIGAQGYLMAGILNRAFQNTAQAETFFNFAEGTRFFKDRDYPNRLVWYDAIHDTNHTKPIILNDDISFVNMAELGLMLFEEE